MVDVAEIFGDREAGERRAHTAPRRLVHLAVDQRRIGDDARLFHVGDHVVPLARALADAGEDGIAAVLFGDVVHQLHDEHRLADARAAEEADLAALAVRGDQVDDLDARLEYLRRGALVVEGGRLAVDVPALLRLDFALVVDGLAEDVEHAAEHPFPDRGRELPARIGHAHPAGQPFRRRHGDAADRTLLFVREYFEDGVRAVDDEFFVHGRHIAVELDVDDRADDLTDPALLSHVFALPFAVRCFP